jgi:hypothetical protein
VTYDELAYMEDEGPHYAFYQDANGNQFHSYEEACHYYGVDTPAQLAAEEAYWDAQEEVWVAATPEWPQMEAPAEFACPF